MSQNDAVAKCFAKHLLSASLGIMFIQQSPFHNRIFNLYLAVVSYSLQQCFLSFFLYVGQLSSAQRSVLGKPFHTNHCPTTSITNFEEQWIFLKTVIKVSDRLTAFQTGNMSKRKWVLRKDCFCPLEDKLSVTKKEERIKKRMSRKDST